LLYIYIYVETLPWGAADFGKLGRGIWKNLLRKTVVSSDEACENVDIDNTKRLIAVVTSATL